MSVFRRSSQAKISGNLSEIRVIVGIGRSAAAKKPEIRGTVCSDLMPFTGWNENRISRFYLSRFAAEFHRAGTLENEIELFAELVKVAFRRSSGRQRGLREALFPHRGIRPIEDAPDGRTVCGGEWLLLVDLIDGHPVQ